ncbi:MAG: hypothetical protein AVDCRST_MAG11-1513, partial [uncultured Gemmatimonadaceae bacterium]
VPDRATPRSDDHRAARDDARRLHEPRGAGGAGDADGTGGASQRRGRLHGQRRL